MTLDQDIAALQAGHADVFRVLSSKAALTIDEQTRAMVMLAVVGHALADRQMALRLADLRDRVIDIENAKGPREAGLLGLGECQA
jgi:hypothetical protein